MKDLHNQKILLIAPTFFGYENQIVNSLRSKGATVSYFQENIDSTGILQKIVNKLPDALRDKERAKYFTTVLGREKLEDFNYVFCIRIDLFNDTILRFLKEKCKKAEFILYYWDSVKNMRNADVNSSYFDKVFTFDLNDYRARKEIGWRFRPLFFIDAFKNISAYKKKDIDLLFVASLSPSRAELYKQLEPFCANNDLKLYAYFYMKPYVWLANRYKVDSYKKLSHKLVHGTGIPLGDVCSLFQRSKVIVDCSSPSQSGLTMRTIECFGANRKILTTNTTLREYDIYNSKNHLIMNDFSESQILSFINDEDYYFPNQDLYKKYSIEGWIEDIFA